MTIPTNRVSSPRAWLCAVLAAMGVCLCASPARGELTLAAEGESDCVILTPPKGDKVEVKAAAELQKYLQQITGAKLASSSLGSASPPASSSS